MQVLQKGLLAFFIMIALISFLLLFVMVSNENFDTIQPLAGDELFRVLEEEYILRNDLTEFVVARDSLILFYDGAGLVNIYSLEGQFRYGIQVERIDNGSGKIGVLDDRLYIEARGGRVYIFSGTELIESFRIREDPGRYNSVKNILAQESKHFDGNAAYYYQNDLNQIRKVDRLGSEDIVISMPRKNKNLKTVALLFLLSGATAALLAKKQWDNTTH